MNPHIDLYSVHITEGYDGHEPHRQFEGQEAIDYADGIGAAKGLPYWNGYKLQTALHYEGECEAHRPEVGKPTYRPVHEDEHGWLWPAEEAKG